MSFDFRTIILALALGCSLMNPSASLAAQKTEATAELKRIPEEFFKRLSSGKVSDAFHTALNGSLIQKRQDQVDNLILQTEAALKIYGRSFGYELAEVETVSPSVDKMTYILRTENAPLRWTFYLYRPQQEWTLVAINFDDQVASWF